MHRPLADKSIVIVGGTTGLGRAGTEVCRAAGAKLVVVGRDEPSCTQLRREIPDCKVVTGDASQPQVSEEAIAIAVAAYGRLDGLYHIAGGSGRAAGDGPVAEISDTGWDYTLQLNLNSVFYSNRAAIRQFLLQGEGGAVLNLSSVLAFAPAPQHFTTHAYAAAKAGVIGLTRSMAAHYATDNIRLNVICPGLVDTPMAQRACQNEEICDYVQQKQALQSGRVGQPSDLNEAVLFFLSEGSRFVTGQVLSVDGGWSVR